jgi:superoxide dismutase
MATPEADRAMVWQLRAGSQFKRTGNALRRLGLDPYNQHTKRSTITGLTITTNPPFSVPLLVRYVQTRDQMDYGAAAAKYVDAFMTNVNWEEVNRRVDSMPR